MNVASPRSSDRHEVEILIPVTSLCNTPNNVTEFFFKAAISADLLLAFQLHPAVVSSSMRGGWTSACRKRTSSTSLWTRNLLAE